MTWLGLDYDEGPFYQTKQFDRYHEVIEDLPLMGLAYRCNCNCERYSGQLAILLIPRNIQQNISLLR